MVVPGALQAAQTVDLPIFAASIDGMVSLAACDGRDLRLTTLQGFSPARWKYLAPFFDDFLTKKFIEQDGREDSNGRMLFRLTDAGRSRCDIARAVSRMRGAIRKPGPPWRSTFANITAIRALSTTLWSTAHNPEL